MWWIENMVQVSAQDKLKLRPGAVCTSGHIQSSFKYEIAKVLSLIITDV